MIHRSQYMSGEFTHRQYYGQFVDQRVKNIVVRNIEISRILNSESYYLNDIDLKRWDLIVETKQIPFVVANKLKECGDWLGLGTGVCILKEAARQIKEERAK